MALLMKPTLTNFIAISNDPAAKDGFQERWIKADNADLSVIDPSKFIIFYGKEAKALSEQPELTGRGYKFAYVEDYTALEKFWNRIGSEIAQYAPLKSRLKEHLVNTYNWNPSDCFDYGGVGDSNWSLLRYYLQQTKGKLIAQDDNARKYAHVVHPADDESIWNQAREKVWGRVREAHHNSHQHKFS